MTSEKKVVTVVVVGDPGVGKTSLARTLTEGSFPTAATIQSLTGHDESVDRCSPYTCSTGNTIITGNNDYNIHVYDPSNDIGKAGKLPKTDVCYICFDLSSPASFNRLKVIWVPLVKKAKVAPIFVLVGLKDDLAKDQGTIRLLTSQGLEPITSAAANSLSNEIGASRFIETSSLKYLGIQELKEFTVFSVLQSNSTQHEERKKCLIM